MEAKTQEMSTEEAKAIQQLNEEAKVEIASRNPGNEKMTRVEALATVSKYLPAKKLGAKQLGEVRRALRDQPGIWRVAGDIGLQAQSQMIERTFGQPVAKEAINAGIDIMKDELGYGGASLLEKLLINQVLLCWLNVHNVQLHYDQ